MRKNKPAHGEGSDLDMYVRKMDQTLHHAHVICVRGYVGERQKKNPQVSADQ